jgi:hypothetical protein
LALKQQTTVLGGSNTLVDCKTVNDCSATNDTFTNDTASATDTFDGHSDDDVITNHRPAGKQRRVDCVICLEPATVVCLQCDGDHYCRGCWAQCHSKDEPAMQGHQQRTY